ncbi:alpha/beta hydrolase [Pedobacter sandarakinus]|uniref:alpha/beta hydrolase n=1 Tax=Pedobacter sandarakinus TaxID=353156 RepID=UPI0022469579|nr:alpha/beta hydrolase family protein [Pedobacter sandarakinus]MCX2574114.1 alpha/beta hydrolase family protein [Pedobacter sandarakinus]
MKRFLILLYLAIFISGYAEAAKVDTIATFSKSMHKTIKATVVLPEKYRVGTGLPVLYLLHGAGGNYKDWISKVPAIKGYADQYKMIIVCPDGNQSSWYFDSPIDSTYRYDTYVSKELVEIIDRKYSTIANRKGRAITGLSMGGHGALYLGIKHQDVFGAMGSMSGGVDIKPFPNGWDLPKRLGAYSEFPQNWKDNSVVDLVGLIKPQLGIIIDCGTNDFFYGVNEHLHQELLRLKIPHDYTSRPGGHSWEYWANSIKYHMVYFSDFFATN